MKVHFDNFLEIIVLIYKMHIYDVETHDLVMVPMEIESNKTLQHTKFDVTFWDALFILQKSNFWAVIAYGCFWIKSSTMHIETIIMNKSSHLNDA